MGIYIGSHLPTGNREPYLRDTLNLTLINKPSEWDFGSDNEEGLVCVIDNNMFKACAVIADEREYRAFGSPAANDNRPMRWYKGDKKVIYDASESSQALWEAEEKKEDKDLIKLHDD